MARAWMLVVFAVALAAFAAPAAATFPGANGSILYGWIGESAYRAGPTATSIRAVEPRDRTVRVLRDCPLRNAPLTYTDCQVYGPRSSPDGRRIAFLSIQTIFDATGAPSQSAPGVATMAADGTDLQERPTPHRYWALAWAPSADRLLLQRNLPVGGYGPPTGLFLATLEGSELNQVAPPWSAAADWSSRGEIAYVRDRRIDASCRARSCADIFVTRLGGTPRRLTYRGGSSPSWSPHGTKLAFVRDPGLGRAGIYVVRRDGTRLRRLTGRGASLAWSPDGRWIAFVRSGHLYVIRTNGRRLRRLVNSPYGLEGPSVVSVDWQAVRAEG